MFGAVEEKMATNCELKRALLYSRRQSAGT